MAVFLKIFVFIFFHFFHKLGADCIADETPFYVNTFMRPLFYFSPTDEIIDGVNYGKIFAFSNGLWMLHQFNISQSTGLITTSCPRGWVPSSEADLANLLSFATTHNMSLLTDPAIFNMDINFTYASNTKQYPNLTDGSDASSWVFYGLKFLNSSYAHITPFNSYFDNNTARTFCVLSSISINNTVTSSSSLSVSGLSSKDLIKGILYNLNVTNTNMIAYKWNISNQTNYSQSLNIIPMKYGYYEIRLNAVFFDGTPIATCFSGWVRNYTGSEATTNLSLTDIHQIQFLDKKVYRSLGLHFNSGAAPLAPIDTGGLYILYANTTNNSLFVKLLNNDGVQLNEYNLKKNGYPFDIVAVPCGFVVLIKDFYASDTLYLMGWSICTGNQTFLRILMDNGYQPNNRKTDQLIFYSDSKGTPLFGMDAMYNPSSGKLVLARDRIVTIFAHYNHFGFNTDGSRNDHTGDTLVSFNLSGLDDKIAFSWGASHSLSESILFNGDKAYATSLSDAYPLNIRFVNAETNTTNSAIDPFTGLKNRLDNSVNSSLLSGIIPGNGGGLSCGRMGTISQFNDGSFNVLSYSRRKCTTTFDGTSETTSIDDMGLAFFDNYLNRTSNIVLGSGAYVNQIQSAKYGANIFLVYVNSNRTDSGNVFLTNTINPTDNMTFMLLDTNGNILNGPFNLNQSILPPSDDMKVLSDGRVAWNWIDTNNNLNYYFLTKPNQTLTNEAVVQSNAIYKGEDFYFVGTNDTNVYLASNNTVNNSTSNNTNNATNNNGSFGKKLLNDSNIFLVVFMIVVGFWIN